MVKHRVFKLEKIPEGSKLWEYNQHFSSMIQKEKDISPKFLFQIFENCWNFISDYLNISHPTIKLKLIWSHEKYRRIEQQRSEGARQVEVAKTPSKAFHVGNRIENDVFIDMEHYVGLVRFGSITFLVNMVETFCHEILHCIFYEEKSEQEIYDMQCSMIEVFLGIELPQNIKNFEASNFYCKEN